MERSPELQDLFGKIYDGAREGEKKRLSKEEYARRRREFVFHMTDWLRDFTQMEALFRNPKKADPHQACINVIGFLYHVVPHLNAAGRLLLDKIGDPFVEADKQARIAKNGKKRTTRRPKVSA